MTSVHNWNSLLLAACLAIGVPAALTRAGDAEQPGQSSTDNGAFAAGTSDDARIAASTPDPDVTAGPLDSSGYDPKLADIITAVMEQEQRYANMESVVRTEQHYDAAKWTIPKTTETVHTIRQGRLLCVEGESIDTLSRGGEVRHRFASAYDGRRSVSVEYDDSANIHDRRYEPSQVFPPHTWGMFHLEVNFPLSVYLSGTSALTRHPKVRRLPREFGSVFEFYKVECEAAGSERISEFDCEKIRVQRWYHTNSRPAIQYLWLAPERNYLCIKSQEMSFVPGGNLPSRESLVEEFQEIGPDLWLPQRVRVTSYDYESLKQGKLIPYSTRSLVLEKTAMNPAYPAGRFHLAIPEDFPVYTIGADGVVDTPHHPHPAPQASSTTLAEITAGIRQNEALYQNMDISLDERYVKPWLNNEYIDGSGHETHTSTRRMHSVSHNEQSFVRAESTHSRRDGTPSSSITITATDGEWLREIGTSNRDNPDTFVVRSALLTQNGGGDVHRLYAHSLLFDDAFDGSLSDHLESQWSDELNGYLHAVAYEADDVIDGLRCHRLRIDHLQGKGRTVSSSRYVWISPDRNFLPIRSQWLTPARHPNLITGMTTVDDWRELQRDIWLPVRWTQVSFKGIDPTGLCENRLIHNWRKDCRAESVTLDPRPEPELFQSVTAQRGTEIYIRDSSGKNLGKILQEQDGILTISPEKWKELTEEAKPETDGPQPATDNGAATAPASAARVDGGKAADKTPATAGASGAFEYRAIAGAARYWTPTGLVAGAAPPAASGW